MLPLAPGRAPGRGAEPIEQAGQAARAHERGRAAPQVDGPKAGQPVLLEIDERWKRELDQVEYFIVKWYHRQVVKEKEETWRDRIRREFLTGENQALAALEQGGGLSAEGEAAAEAEGARRHGPVDQGTGRRARRVLEGAAACAGADSSAVAGMAAGAQAARIMLANISNDKIVKSFLFIPLSSSRKIWIFPAFAGFTNDLNVYGEI